MTLVSYASQICVREGIIYINRNVQTKNIRGSRVSLQQCVITMINANAGNIIIRCNNVQCVRNKVHVIYHP